MPLQTIDEIITEGSVRFWLQFGAEVGAAPTNELQYAGTDAQYLRIDDAENPVRGDISPINVPDPFRLKRFRRAGQTQEAPDPPTFDVTFLQKHGAIPRQLYNLGECPATFYRLAGTCKDLSDFDRGWTDYVLIYSNALVTDRGVGGVGAFDSDDALEDEVSFTADAIYPVGKMNYEIELDEATYASVTSIAAVYGTPNSCSACRAGNEILYVAGSNGTSHNVYYTLNSGATWSVLNLTTSATLAPTAIAIAGNNLIVTFTDSSDRGGYFLSVIDDATGTPGTALKITTGVASGTDINDVFVLSPQRVFFAADDGIIYKSTNLANGVSIADSGSVGTSAYTRISGIRASSGGAIIVAGAETGEVLYSRDDGVTWSETVAAPDGGVITAIAVLSERRLWVATDSPALFFSADLGETWESYELPEPYGNVLQINDVRFATDEVGYLTAQVDKSGFANVIYGTINGGRTWNVGESRFATDLVVSSATRIAVPEGDNIAVNANNMAVAAGADGTLLFAAAVR